MTRHFISCALCVVGGDPDLGVNGGKPAALYGEAPDCTLGVAGTVHHGADLGAGIGGEDGWGETVHHGAGHVVIPRLHPKFFRFMPNNMCHRV